MDIPTRPTPVTPTGQRPASPASRRPASRRSDLLSVLGQLTTRDRQLLDLLDEHEVLTTSQLARLAFPSRSMAQRRLLRLTGLGVFDRFRWHLPVGSQDWRYTTGLLGEELIAAARGVTPPRPAEHHRRLTRLAASPRLGHLLGVNDLFTRLAGHARSHPGCALSAWWPERRCAGRYGQLVRPDGYGTWTQGGQHVEFFVEYDTGTEPLTRVVAKLPGYADLAAAGGPALPVLIWVPTLRREANLLTALAQPWPVTVATASTELARSYQQGPAGAVWHTRLSQHRQPLISLGRPDIPPGEPAGYAGMPAPLPPAGGRW